MPVSPSTSADGDAAGDWAPLPTETDIYLLPDGRVVIADMPAELSALALALGPAEPCAVTPGGGALSNHAAPSDPTQSQQA
jgi:hypothetical protein